MASISTSTFLGSVLTATQLRAGLWEKNFSYSPFISYQGKNDEMAILLVESPGMSTYSKVGHVGDENGRLDDLGEGRAGLLEDGVEVLAAQARLFGNGAVNQRALGGEGDLARAVDGRGGLDGLRLGMENCQLRDCSTLGICSSRWCDGEGLT